jgi:hypothetical protein
MVQILEAFQLMWGNFPDPVILVHRDRTILAVNDASAAQGTAPGVKCFSYNPVPSDVEGGVCKGCQADRALQTGTAISCSCRSAAARGHGYWIPLKGSREVYVHGFTSGSSALPVLS